VSWWALWLCIGVPFMSRQAQVSWLGEPMCGKQTRCDVAICAVVLPLLWEHSRC
jgi:hypothetical protein